MLETLFGSVLTAGITAASFTVCLIAALALGALVAAVYMYKNTSTQSMAVKLALLPAMVQIIILLVNGNLGAGVAVSGAFGLVRFRSAPGSARDITCIFLAMTLGLATGMGYIGIAVMTGVVMCLLLLVYAAMSFGRRPEEEKELKITIPENLDYTGLFDDLFAQYTRASELTCELLTVVPAPISAFSRMEFGPMTAPAPTLQPGRMWQPGRMTAPGAMSASGAI